MKLFLSILIILSSFCSCVSDFSKKYTDGYPDHWWLEIPKDQLASWEISPSVARRDKSEVILSKRNELGKLSNFTAAEFILDGESYASIEGLWQCMKFPENESDPRAQDKTLNWKYTRKQVMKMSSFEAKRAGDIAGENMKKLGIKWITYQGRRIDYRGQEQDKHYDIILKASRAKLAAHPEIKAILMQTKNLKLMPDHAQRTDDPPSYRYYDIYMKLRSEFSTESSLQ